MQPLITPSCIPVPAVVMEVAAIVPTVVMEVAATGLTTVFSHVLVLAHQRGVSKGET